MKSSLSITLKCHLTIPRTDWAFLTNWTHCSLNFFCDKYSNIIFFFCWSQFNYLISLLHSVARWQVMPNMHHLAFVWVKLQQPLFWPLYKSVQIFLERACILQNCYLRPDLRIICKHLDTFFIQSGKKKSRINMKNNSGPRTDLWGTPPWMTSNCLRQKPSSKIPYPCQ